MPTFAQAEKSSRPLSLLEAVTHLVTRSKTDGQRNKQTVFQEPHRYCCNSPPAVQCQNTFKPGQQQSIAAEQIHHKNLKHASSLPYLHLPIHPTRQPATAKMVLPSTIAKSATHLLSARILVRPEIDPTTLCHSATFFPNPPPTDVADLLEDARLFCKRAAEVKPRMTPGTVLMANGRGVSTKQHFRITWIQGCQAEEGVPPPSTADPLGDGKVIIGEETDDRCTWILYQNWKLCECLLLLALSPSVGLFFLVSFC